MQKKIPRQGKQTSAIYLKMKRWQRRLKNTPVSSTKVSVDIGRKTGVSIHGKQWNMS